MGLLLVGVTGLGVGLEEVGGAGKGGAVGQRGDITGRGCGDGVGDDPRLVPVCNKALRLRRMTLPFSMDTR